MIIQPSHSSDLTAASRTEALNSLSSDGVDLLVIGGGVTGAGIALDAASRGLRTAVVEMQDWSAGTSSRSSRLVHGGLRYLYQLDVELVAEALRERGRLLDVIAPHLVQPQPFLWPLRTPVIERAYSAVGVGLYDLISRTRGGQLPIQQHLSKRAALELFPDVRRDQLVGAIRFFDAAVDDARLVIALIRTAVAHGALAAAHTEVVELVRHGGAVIGARLRDRLDGTEREVRAAHVISATGVWTEQVERRAGANPSEALEVLASKGIHLVFERDRISGEVGLFLRTEKSVLFIIPSPTHWIIGTTDTPWEGDPDEPVATSEDIDYVLEHANAVLSSELTRDDIVGVYAGLRPLVQPVSAQSSAKISREHLIAPVAEGMSAIAGGKLTTYRQMAEDAVDFALAERAAETPCVTADLPLVGAAPWSVVSNLATRLGRDLGWTPHRAEHLGRRYGTEVARIAELIEQHPDLAAPLTAAPEYLRAEVVFAVRAEGALTLADVLRHRIRLAHEERDSGRAAAEEIADLVGAELGWDDHQRREQLETWDEWVHRHDRSYQL
ncbi:FAD-dependent oxidoreductase [Enemella sp. A6]|uniref:glycerol-3-phosphate dehydrogenase/oxidase n=1 Tax=Enemella sp. A6 TaxID=3440152 RepID=UPI003EBB765C